MTGPKLAVAEESDADTAPAPVAGDDQPAILSPDAPAGVVNSPDGASVSTTGIPDISELFATADPQKMAPAIGALLTAARAQHPEIADYCLLAIFDEKSSIGSFELDRIYRGLSKQNPQRSKNVFLLLLSNGGSIEPAYQISKLCKGFARDKFIVGVPRFAKSAATLIALGADEIHMGILGHLGPIDPQVGGLPALAVARALDALAILAEKHPGSSEMLGSYLKEKLQVQQIGYYERVAESAVQYGQRLLKMKDPKVLASDPATIAQMLVHDYKDHGFVIDPDEAREILGAGWVKQGTPEAAFAEAVYSAFDFASTMISIAPKNKGRKLLVIGSIAPEDIAHTIMVL